VNAAPKPEGKFGIQVGALFGADRAARAAQRKTELKSSAGINVEILPSADGNAARLIVTGFADRRAAESACAELRKRPDFKDAWIVSL
jgi:cell division septation protein DedD